LRDLAGVIVLLVVGVAVLGGQLLQTRPARTLFGQNTRPTTSDDHAPERLLERRSTSSRAMLRSGYKHGSPISG
jgi:hypothetical protein